MTLLSAYLGLALLTIGIGGLIGLGVSAYQEHKACKLAQLRSSSLPSLSRSEG